jgi:hypothetical protein
LARRRGDLKGPTPTKTFWQKYQWYIIIGIAFFFVITVIVPALSTAPEEDSQTTGQTDGIPDTSVPDELHFTAQQSDHITFLQTARTYNSNPPTSGQHWNEPGVAPTTWGIKSQPLADEILVHNLEHGGIVAHYRPGDELAQQELEQFLKGQPNFPTGYILAPRNNLPSRVTLTAWEYLLGLFVIDQQQMRAFISQHYDQGPEGLAGGPR